MNRRFTQACMGAVLVGFAGWAVAATEVLTANTGSAMPQTFVPQFFDRPPTPSAEQLQRQRDFEARPRGAGTLAPSFAPAVAPQPGSQTQLGDRAIIADPDDPAATVEPLAANTFTIFRKKKLAPTGGGGSSDVNEPSHAGTGKFIWYTGNWYAARSTDASSSWTYVNPYADFSDFCCDQDAILDEGRNLLIWYRQGVQLAGGNNNIKISVSTDNGATWATYTLTYTNWTGLPLGWFDYPHLALTNNHLYITSNFFTGNTFQRMIVTKIPLDQLQAKGAIGFTWWSRTTGWTWTPTQGAKDVMYLGDHTSQTAFNICDQPDSNSTLTCRDVAVPAWTATGRGSAVCTTSNGLNPCARLDQRVNVGWLKEDRANNRHVLGFFWTVAQGAGFTFPYVNAIAVEPQSFTLLPGNQGRPLIWNGSGAFIYGGAAANGRGALGISTWFVGGSVYPQLYVGIDDDYNAPPPGWSIALVAASTNVVASRWGDYTRVRPVVPTVGAWSVSGHVTVGTVQSPYYAAFGRGRDQANWTRFKGK